MTNSNVVRVDISIDHSWQEILVAEMSDLGFYAFESQENSVRGYIEEALWSTAHRKKLVSSLTSRVQLVQIREDIIPPQNWNEEWEASIQPVVAGGFVVLPTWKEIPKTLTPVEPIFVNPKMSFGTGHHETTRLMLELMTKTDLRGKRVLDAGTGTGVLAIAASKRGASSVLGFDIDPWSSTNAEENITLNGVSGVSIKHGTLSDVPERQFDIILANIIQRVIEEFMVGFAARMSEKGDLLVSGILSKDEDDFLHQAEVAGFSPHVRLYESEWAAYRLKFTE